MSDIIVNNPNESNTVVTVQSVQSVSVVQTAPTNMVVAGVIGGGADASFVYDQGSPDDVWEIQHNLNKKPSVTVVNYYDVVVYGSVEYIDNNNVKITFEAGAFSGRAYFN